MYANQQVMFWIHGGALIMGGACMFDGSPLAAYENIVVVVIQYRLGMLGYFRYSFMVEKVGTLSPENDIRFLVSY